MNIFMTETYLEFFEALASKTRLKIISLLAIKDMNIKELAEELGLSSAIVTKHIQKLEKTEIISTSLVNKNGSLHKMCILLYTSYEIERPIHKENTDLTKKCYTVNLPVGQFSKIKCIPPCGLASEFAIIGDLDKPRQMISPERYMANLVWFGGGYVEYKLPNYSLEQQKITDIEISAEFGSESVGFCDDWISTIDVYLNNIKICDFTTPGDFGNKRGLLTPLWWENNQYGILIVIKINDSGVYVNGRKIKNVNINDFNNMSEDWSLKFETNKISDHGGGITIFGEKFGNYNQNIVFKQYFL